MSCESRLPALVSAFILGLSALPLRAEEPPVQKLELSRSALAEEGFELRWASQAPLRENGAGPIAQLYMLGGMIVARTSDNQLVAFDADTGAYRWMRLVGRQDRPSFPPTYNAPKLLPGGATDMPRLYVTNYDEVFKINAKTGATESNFKLPFLPCTAFAREGDIAVVGAENQRIYFLDGEKAYRIANRQLPGYLPHNPLFEDPDERGDRNIVYFSDSAGRVYAYSKDRVVYWEFPPPRESVGKISGPLSKTPKIKSVSDKNEVSFQDYSLIFVPTDDNSLFAIAKQSGKTRWQKRSNAAFREEAVTVVSRPDSAIDEDRVYVRNAERTLYALSPAKGDDIWDLPNAGRFVCAGRNSRLSVFLLEDDPKSPAFNTISEVVSLRKAAGAGEGGRTVMVPKVKARYQLGDISLFASNPDDPIVFGATPDGRFYAIKVAEGEVRERKKDEQPPTLRILTPGKREPGKEGDRPKVTPKAKKTKDEAADPAEEKKPEEKKKAKK